MSIERCRDILRNLINELPKNISNEDYATFEELAIELQTAIKSNNDLHKVANHLKYKIYDDINDIFGAPTQDDHIYIYIKDIKKYVEFKDPESFGMAMCLLSGNSDKSPFSNFVVHQIIPTDYPQKLILSYNNTDENAANKICKLAEGYFKTSAVIVYNAAWNLYQLVINVKLKKFDDSVQLFQSFYKYLEFEEKSSGDGLNIPPKNYHYSGIAYISALVSHRDWTNPESIPLPEYYSEFLLTNITGGRFSRACIVVDNIPQNPLILNTDRNYVYLIITTPYSGAVKIGTSGDCDKRTHQLQTGNSEQLVVYASVCAHKSLETKLHHMFKERRRTGEWFQFHANELPMLKKCLENCSILM